LEPKGKKKANFFQKSQIWKIKKKP
jgi:hypothetical protein